MLHNEAGELLVQGYEATHDAEGIAKAYSVSKWTVYRLEEVALKFSDLLELLPERQFQPCHRSYLVNLEHIAYVRSRDLELTTREVLPVSRYRAEDLQKQFVAYLRG